MFLVILEQINNYKYIKNKNIYINILIRIKRAYNKLVTLKSLYYNSYGTNYQLNVKKRSRKVPSSIP